MSEGTEPPLIVLVRPQLGENIGKAARAMLNFGLTEMRLVAPRDGWPNPSAGPAASGADEVLANAKVYPSVAEAVADRAHVYATTVRKRGVTKPVLTPEEAVAALRERIQKGERCGILFGRERNGLETSELAIADALVMIPVNSRFASLNLAQAVLLLGYVWMRGSGKGSLGRVTTYESPISEGLNLGNGRLADKKEMFGFFDHLETELDRLGFFNPAEKRPSVVQNLRTMFIRMALTEQEVRTLRGIVATLSRGKGHGRKSST